MSSQHAGQMESCDSHIRILEILARVGAPECMCKTDYYYSKGAEAFYI